MWRGQAWDRCSRQLASHRRQLCRNAPSDYKDVTVPCPTLARKGFGMPQNSQTVWPQDPQFKKYTKNAPEIEQSGNIKVFGRSGDVQQEIIDQFPYFKDFDRLICEENSLQTSTPHNPNYQPSNSPKASPEFDNNYNKTSQVSIASVDDYRVRSIWRNNSQWAVTC